MHEFYIGVNIVIMLAVYHGFVMYLLEFKPSDDFDNVDLASILRDLQVHLNF